jgi:signal recognition particle subunit SEC65
MKDYARYVIWLDYFNSELKRSEGRRVPLSSATRAPRLEELTEACRRLNLQPSAQPASFPATAGKESGYVSVLKVKPKQSLVLKVGRELAVVRGQAARKPAQKKSGRKK